MLSLMFQPEMDALSFAIADSAQAIPLNNGQTIQQISVTDLYVLSRTQRVSTTVFEPFVHLCAKHVSAATTCPHRPMLDSSWDAKRERTRRTRYEPRASAATRTLLGVGVLKTSARGAGRATGRLEA